MSPQRRKTAHKRLWALQGGRCCYCDEPMRHVGGAGPRVATIEHLRRQAEGGTNRWDNLALACFECNTGRGSTDWFAYKTYRMGELAA